MTYIINKIWNNISKSEHQQIVKFVGSGGYLLAFEAFMTRERFLAPLLYIK